MEMKEIEVKYVCMYVCISLYSLPFTGFESLPESVQNKSLNHPQKPPSNFAPRHGASSLKVTDFFMMGPTV